MTPVPSRSGALMAGQSAPRDDRSLEVAEQLIEAVRQLSTARSLADITGITKKAARQLTGADGASFVLRDDNRCYYVDEDAIEPLWKGRRFPLETCVSGWTMLHRQAAVIPDVFADSRVPHDAYRPTFVKSMVMVPIRALRPVGAIGIYWKQAFRPTTQAVRWLQSLADSTALALECLQAQQEIQDAQLEASLLRQASAGQRQERLPLPESGLLRMCFITKRIEVAGQWLTIEAFLKEQLGVEITHGLSPEGLSRLGSEDSPELSLLECDAKA